MSPTANGNGHRIATQRASLNGSTAEDAVASFWRRYEHVKNSGDMKNVLIEDVITRYENLLRKHQEYLDLHESERGYFGSFQEREQMLNNSLQRMQKIMNRDPHILVLLDGDGMIFQNSFLLQGSFGGKQAATALQEAITKWASANVIDYPTDSKVVVRVYANIKGLAETCYRAGLVESPAKFEEFTRGFTCGETLFDFVDVGSGKDRADAKINEAFKLYLYNYHCRQIFLGCSNDNGFARLLEQYVDDEEALHRVTLLEGVPFEKELVILPFPKTKLPGLFRETKIVIPQPDYSSSRPLRADSRGALNGAGDVFTPRSLTPGLQSPSPFSSVTSLQGATIGAPLTHVRTDSIASSAATSDSGTWATVVNKNKSRPLLDLHRASTDSHSSDTVRRNRAGQRVDTPGEYDREEVQRIKKLKGCNQHYIGVGCCHYNAGREDKCPHNHKYNFTAAELKTLRVVAKETPCKRGHDCDDAKCIYGHMCPFPLATEGSMRGLGCINGDACRFPRSMHNMDQTPVRTIRVC